MKRAKVTVEITHKGMAYVEYDGTQEDLEQRVWLMQAHEFDVGEGKVDYLNWNSEDDDD